MNNPVDPAEPQPDLQVIVVRSLAASRARVFRAWIDPLLMEKWFAPPDMHEDIVPPLAHIRCCFQHTRWIPLSVTPLGGEREHREHSFADPHNERSRLIKVSVGRLKTVDSGP